MKQPVCLEVCVDSLESAKAAKRGGADRLELCTCLLAGGLTPDPYFLRQVKSACCIPVRCLMRPRFGDFLYDSSEIDLMADQIGRLADAGADGFVIGCLTETGELDLPAMNRLIAAAKGKNLTLHRAFDVCSDGFKAAKQAADLGIDTILTSGQKSSCLAGKAYLEQLLALDLPLTVMAGAGVTPEVIRDLSASLPLRTFHMSGKKIVESGMIFRREGVPMGLPGMDEFSVWQTDEETVRRAAAVLKEATAL